MNSDDIARVLEEAEEWLTPSSDVGTTDPDAWGSYEDVIRGLAAIVREQQAEIERLTKWRPMDTAPRDGTPILALDREGPVIIWYSNAIAGATACGPKGEWRWAKGPVDCAYPPLGWLPLPAAEVGK